MRRNTQYGIGIAVVLVLVIGLLIPWGGDEEPSQQRDLVKNDNTAQTTDSPTDDSAEPSRDDGNEPDSAEPETNDRDELADRLPEAGRYRSITIRRSDTDTSDAPDPADTTDDTDSGDVADASDSYDTISASPPPSGLPAVSEFDGRRELADAADEVGLAGSGMSTVPGDEAPAFDDGSSDEPASETDAEEGLALHVGGLGSDDSRRDDYVAIVPHDRIHIGPTRVETDVREEPSSSTDAATPTSRRAGDTATKHRIQSGDTFSGLAVRYYGNAKYTQRIQDANPNIDPDRLHVGKEVVIPAMPAEAADELASRTSGEGSTASTERATGLSDRQYKVKQGETWSDLGQKFYGKRMDYVRLYEYNKDRVPSNHDLLPAGTILELPEGVELPSAPQPTTADSESSEAADAE